MKIFTKLLMGALCLSTAFSAVAWDYTGGTDPYKVSLYFKKGGIEGKKEMTFNNGTWYLTFKAVEGYVNFEVCSRYGSDDNGGDKWYKEDAGSITVGEWACQGDYITIEGQTFYLAGLTAGNYYTIELTGDENSNNDRFKFRAVNTNESELTTVYYDNTLTGWVEPNAYCWKDKGYGEHWPGFAMTKVEGTENIWSFTAPVGAKILFNDGSENPNHTKTGNFDVAADAVYTVKGNQDAYANYTESAFNAQLFKVTIYGGFSSWSNSPENMGAEFTKTPDSNGEVVFGPYYGGDSHYFAIYVYNDEFNKWIVPAVWKDRGMTQSEWKQGTAYIFDGRDDRSFAPMEAGESCYVVANVKTNQVKIVRQRTVALASFFNDWKFWGDGNANVTLAICDVNGIGRFNANSTVEGTNPNIPESLGNHMKLKVWDGRSDVFYRTGEIFSFNNWYTIESQAENGDTDIAFVGETFDAKYVNVIFDALNGRVKVEGFKFVTDGNKVSFVYPEGAQEVQYKLNGSEDWTNYTGAIELAESSTITAKVKYSDTYTFTTSKDFSIIEGTVMSHPSVSIATSGEHQVLYISVEEGHHIVISYEEAPKNGAQKAPRKAAPAGQAIEASTYKLEITDEHAGYLVHVQSLNPETGIMSGKSSIVVNEDKTATGVESVATEPVEGVVEYFNLQGVKVMNPENGIYIRRQGNKVTKVIVK